LVRSPEEIRVERLAAPLDLDRDITSMVAQPPLDRMRHRIGCLRSGDHGEEFGAVTDDLVEQVDRRPFHRGADRHDAVAADEPDPVALHHLADLAVGVADRLREFAGHDRCGGLVHLLLVGLDPGFGVVDDERGERLGHRARGDDGDPLRCECVDLLGDRDDVLVVRQYHDLVGIDVLDGLEQFSGGRVECLAAGDHTLHTELSEQFDEPLTGAHRDDRCRDRRESGCGDARGGLLAGEFGLTPGVFLVDLPEQIGDTDLLRTPIEVEGHLDRRTDVVGVDVAVPQSVAAYDDDRVPDRAPAGLELVDALVGEVHEVHHLVPLLAHVEIAGMARGPMGDRCEHVAHGTGRAVVGFGLGERVARHDVQCGVEHQEIAGPARVDHAGVLQDRQEIGGPLERHPPLVARRADHLLERATAVGRDPRGLGGLAGHGEDRALDRVPHGLVGADRRRLERRRELRPFHLGLLLDRSGEPAQDLTEDHAAVAARTHQRAVADGVTGGAEHIVRAGRAARARRTRVRRSRVGRNAVHLFHDGVERAGHVRPGVTVGDRVHVQPVEHLGVRSNRVSEGPHRGAQGLGVQPLEWWHGSTLYVVSSIRPASAESPRGVLLTAW
jgi:hypothetical protein